MGYGLVKGPAVVLDDGGESYWDVSRLSTDVVSVAVPVWPEGARCTSRRTDWCEVSLQVAVMSEECGGTIRGKREEGGYGS